MVGMPHAATAVGRWGGTLSPVPAGLLGRIAGRSSSTSGTTSPSGGRSLADRPGGSSSVIVHLFRGTTLGICRATLSGAGPRLRWYRDERALSTRPFSGRRHRRGTPASQYQPAVRAMRRASTRLRASSLAVAAVRQFRTVPTDRYNVLAISLVSAASEASRSTSSSRRVNGR